MDHRLHLLLSAIAVAFAGCGDDVPADESDAPGAAAALWFEDVATASGADFVHDFGPRRLWMPEVGAGGLGLFDMEGDGDLDLYVVQAADLESPDAPERSNRLFANRGDGTFEDVTERAGVGDTGFGYGCAVGDYNGDGVLDLYVTNVGPNVLYRGLGGGRFEDVTEASGAAGQGWGTAATFVDLDGDGDQDLFVTNYLHWTADAERDCKTPRGELTYCSPSSYAGQARDLFLRNRGDGTFEDASLEIGLEAAFGPGFGIVWGAIDDRPGLDVYVANDGMANQLWSSTPEGTLVDRGPDLGCALSGNGNPEAGMGVCLEDVNCDGLWDLMLTHVAGETNTLYTGRKRGFRDGSNRSGTTSASLARTGFGIGLIDFDHDGTLDAYVANGRVVHPASPDDPAEPLGEADQVFAGLGDGRFELLDETVIGQARRYTTARGAAFGDIDGDGDVDVCLNDCGGALRVLRNVAPKRGGSVLLSVLESDGLAAVGAVVRYGLAGESHMRQVQRTYSYCSSNDPRVHIGLGEAPRLESVEVTWLDGETTEFGPFEAGAMPMLRRP